MKKKYAKSEVEYGEGKPEAHCGICKHFEVYHKKACAIVQGVILPQMWCNKFKKKS